MNNKVYKKVWDFIKENIKIIVVLVVLYFVLTIKLPWSIYAPGGIINVQDRITGAKYQPKGTFNLTYVSFIDGNIPTLLLANIIPTWDIVKNDNILLEGEDLEDSLLRDKINLKESISNATYLAYQKAGLEVNIIEESNYITYISNTANTDLKMGDKILKYDGETFTTFESMREYVSKKNIGDLINFEIIRGKSQKKCYAQVIAILNEPKIGIMISKVYTYANEPNIEYQIRNSESGASGGLMLSLAIYNSLIEQDLTKGLKISGTGTISLDGTVGEISGIKYKLAGAVKKKSDIFIVPTENYQEALRVKKDNNYKIKLIEAKTFDQVIKELENI